MSDLVLRDATPGDIPAMLRLAHLGDARGAHTPPLDEASLDDPRYRAAFEEIVSDPAHRLIVGERDGTVVGTIHITILPGLTHFGARRGLLENVFVDPRHRGGGIGTKLVEWAIDYCRGRGCTIIQLTSNKQRTDAHRFYRRLGFVASHEGFKLRF